MVKETVKYGLRHKKMNRLLEIEKTYNGKDAEFCGEYSYELSEYGEKDGTWLVDNPITAELVRNYSTPWYNSDYDQPQNFFSPEELEVVEVKVIEEENVIQVEVPTIEQLLTVKYFKKEKNHLHYMLDLLQKGVDIAISLAEIRILMYETPNWKELYEEYKKEIESGVAQLDRATDF